MKEFLFIIILALLTSNLYSQSADEANTNLANKRKTGYYNTTQISMLMGNRSMFEHNFYRSYEVTKLHVIPSVTMVHGWMFNEKVAAGVGTGFEIFDHNLFPVFLEMRRTVRDHNVSPFFAVKLGYSIGNLKKKHYDELFVNFQPYLINNAYLRHYGGLIFHPEMGVKIPLSVNSDLLFTVAYRYQKTKSEVSQDFGHQPKWTYEASYNRLSLGAAIMFRSL